MVRLCAGEGKREVGRGRKKKKIHRILHTPAEFDITRCISWRRERKICHVLRDLDPR